MDRGGMAEHRDELLRGLTGEVIEVGAGNGLNFARYPPEVTRVLAVEPELHLRHIGERNARRAPVPVEVINGTAERLDVPDASFDFGVASLVLCSIGDQGAALRELRRVIRPGGELRFLEHVRAPSPGLARVQRVLDATVWPRLAGGCHTHRDTGSALEQAGFELRRIQGFRFPVSRLPLPTSPHILGAALRP